MNKLLIAILASSALVGCGGGSNSNDTKTTEQVEPNEIIESPAAETATETQAAEPVKTLLTASVETVEPLDIEAVETIEAQATATVNVTDKTQTEYATINPVQIIPAGERKPQSFSLTAIDALATQGSHGFKLSWTVSEGATQYQVCLKNSDQPDNCQKTGTALPAKTACSTDSCSANIALVLADYSNHDATYFIIASNKTGDTASNEKELTKESKLAAAGYIKAANPGEDDEFGYAVSLSADGQTLAVGVPYEDGNYDSTPENPNDGLNDSGAVYLFTRQNNTWNLQDYIKNSTGSLSDFFGASVSLSADGKTLAVGAPLESGDANSLQFLDRNKIIRPYNNNQPQAGAVFILSPYDNEWLITQVIKADDATSGDNFGKVVSLSSDGRTLAVGSRETLPGSRRSAVYVFRKSDSSQIWGQQAKLEHVVTADDHFGAAIALSGDGQTLAVGAPFEDGDNSSTAVQSNNNAKNSGAVYLFRQNNNSWNQPFYIKARKVVVDGKFGQSVSLSNDGKTLAVGAPGTLGTPDTPENGRAYIITHLENIQNYQFYLRNFYPDDVDEFGLGIALSSDGQTAAVAGENGVSLYRRSYSHWTHIGNIASAYPDLDYSFGESVALSGDGQTLAVGVPGESGDIYSTADRRNQNAEYAGAVYIY